MHVEKEKVDELKKNPNPKNVKKKIREFNKRQEKRENLLFEKHGEFSEPFIGRAIYNKDEKLLSLMRSFYEDKKDELQLKIYDFKERANVDWISKDESIENSLYEYQYSILEKEEEDIKKLLLEKCNFDFSIRNSRDKDKKDSEKSNIQFNKDIK